MTNNLKKIIILCVNQINIELEHSRQQLLQEIENLTAQNYKIIIIFFYENDYLSIFLENNDYLKNLFKDHLFEKNESDLLCFCPGAVYASILSHRLKALNYKAASLTGFQTGKYNNNEKPVYSFNKSIIKSYLKRNDVLLISGTHGLDENGNLNILDRHNFCKFVDSMKIAVNADYINYFNTGKSKKTESKNIKPSCNNLVIKEETFRKKSSNPLIIPFEKRKIVSGIIIVLNVAEFMLDFSKFAESEQLKMLVLESLAYEGISLDMINICYDSVYFIIDESFCEKVQDTIKKFDITAVTRKNLVKLSVSGVGMKGTPGVMAKIYDALDKVNVDILRNTDSHITISSLIDEESLPIALEVLMEKFNLERQDLTFENTLK